LGNSPCAQFGTVNGKEHQNVIDVSCEVTGSLCTKVNGSELIYAGRHKWERRLRNSTALRKKWNV